MPPLFNKGARQVKEIKMNQEFKEEKKHALNTNFVTFLQGGMKAVVWTDTLQTFIMLAGVLSSIIKATLDIGGVQNVVEAVERGQRQTITK